MGSMGIAVIPCLARDAEEGVGKRYCRCQIEISLMPRPLIGSVHVTERGNKLMTRGKSPTFSPPTGQPSIHLQLGFCLATLAMEGDDAYLGYYRSVPWRAVSDPMCRLYFSREWPRDYRPHTIKPSRQRAFRQNELPWHSGSSTSISGRSRR